MKALTIWQPWASLIMIGAKPYEFRFYPAPRFVQGQRIVIHAGARPVKMVEFDELLTNLGTEDDGAYLREDLARPFLERCNTGLVANRPLEYRAGLGTAVLGTPVRAMEVPEIRARQRFDLRIDENCWAWPVTDIRRWAEPVECSGAQGFGDWPFPIGEERVADTGG